jgi:hypothetical protein
MQNIIPGEINSRKPDLAKGASNGLAIGDVQHWERLTRGIGAWLFVLGHKPATVLANLMIGDSR